MTIHHTQIRKAEKMGCMLDEQGDLTMIHWPKRNVRLYGVSPKEAIAQMEAAQELAAEYPDLSFEPDFDNRRFVVASMPSETAGMQRIISPVPSTPHQLLQLTKADDFQWTEVSYGDMPETRELEDTLGDRAPDQGQTTEPAAQPEPEVERSESGVALNGAVAYKEGTPAGDNPFDEGSEESESWWEAWDTAADEADAEDDEKTGSVVNEKYRAKYAELGHPTHCGDWMADMLNNLCLTKEGTDLIRFEAICEANGVDLSKYNRTTPGWQGRLRMTGRNLLAKAVWRNDGQLIVPDDADSPYKAPGDWMESQRYKMPKKEQAAQPKTTEKEDA